MFSSVLDHSAISQNDLVLSHAVDRRSESREELLEAEWEERKAKRDEERRRHLSVAEEYI